MHAYTHSVLALSTLLLCYKICYLKQWSGGQPKIQDNEMLIKITYIITFPPIFGERLIISHASVDILFMEIKIHELQKMQCTCSYQLSPWVLGRFKKKIKNCLLQTDFVFLRCNFRWECWIRVQKSSSENPIS